MIKHVYIHGLLQIQELINVILLCR